MQRLIRVMIYAAAAAFVMTADDVPTDCTAVDPGSASATGAYTCYVPTAPINLSFSAVAQCGVSFAKRVGLQRLVSDIYLARTEFGIRQRGLRPQHASVPLPGLSSHGGHFGSGR
jgi:hypothetical protein